MSDWKEETARYKVERHTLAEEKPVGKARGRKPSPKKRPRETPLWRITYDKSGAGWHRSYAYVSAETATEARAKATMPPDEPTCGIARITRLHQKDRESFADLIDQPRFLTDIEEMARLYPNSKSIQRLVRPREEEEEEGEHSDGTNT